MVLCRTGISSHSYSVVLQPDRESRRLDGLLFSAARMPFKSVLLCEQTRNILHLPVSANAMCVSAMNWPRALWYSSLRPSSASSIVNTKSLSPAMSLFLSFKIRWKVRYPVLSAHSSPYLAKSLTLSNGFLPLDLPWKPQGVQSQIQRPFLLAFGRQCFFLMHFRLTSKSGYHHDLHCLLMRNGCRSSRFWKSSLPGFAGIAFSNNILAD